MRRDADRDFIEALARGLDVLRSFQPGRPCMALTEVAAQVGLARPTARRVLITLQQLGYLRSEPAGYSLTPRPPHQAADPHPQEDRRPTARTALTSLNTTA